MEVFSTSFACYVTYNGFLGFNSYMTEPKALYEWRVVKRRNLVELGDSVVDSLLGRSGRQR